MQKLTGGPGRVLKPLILALAATVVVLGVVEGGHTLLELLTHGLSGPGRMVKERQLFLDKLPIDDQTNADSETDSEARARPWFARQELHPYFGFVNDRTLPEANNQGFVTAKTYPYKCQPREFVVGIFGGSVAEQVAARPDTLRELLLSELSLKGYDTVTVLQLAIGAAKEPTSFNVFCTFLPDIDMAIFLDGLNEAQWSLSHLPDYPASFPARMVYSSLAAPAKSPYVARDAALLSLLTERAAERTRQLNASPLRFSIVAHLVWRAKTSHYQRIADELRAAITSDSAKDWSGIEPVDRDGIDATIDRYHRLYEDLTLYADMIAKSQSKLFFHFIQPNQYVTGGKKLSDEERSLYVTMPMGVFDPHYRRLDAMSERLRFHGVASFSLSMAFADIGETLYADDCCHFNFHGIDRLHRAMAERIIASRALDQVPEAGSRPLPAWRLRPSTDAR